MKFFKALTLFLFSSLFITVPAHASLKVGTVFFYPPFVTADGAGFDIDLIQIICRRMGEDCKLVRMEFNQLFVELNKGNIDIAVGGIMIFPREPENNYIFSLPYVLSKGTFLVAQKDNIQSINELVGSKVGVIKGKKGGGVFYDYLERNYPGQFKVQKYNRMDDMIEALRDGVIKAAFTHESTVVYWELNSSGKFKRFGSPLIIGDGIAIMSTPKNAPLIGKINEQLEKIENEPTYLNLYNTYFAQER